MTVNWNKIFGVFTDLILVIFFITECSCTYSKKPEIIELDTVVDTIVPKKGISDSLTLENVYYYLDSIGVHHKDIVLKQAILETGWFKSYSCRKRNNLFGLTNGRTKKYYEFNHWKESCIGYRDMVQYKYAKMGYKYEKNDYYHFLVKMHYAADKSYINKLKHIKYKF